MGYHSDGEELFQATKQKACIVSISVGATRRFAIRSKQQGTEKIVHLSHGDILTMEDWFQRHFEHSLVPETRPVDQRFNLTLREIVRHAPSCSLSES